MSESMVCCPLSSDDDAGPSCSSVLTPKARKTHRCYECHETIPVGTKYEKYSGIWDGRANTYKTCLSCVEIRDHFNCNGFLFGQLWSDLADNFFPDMRAGGPCMEGLSPAAKQRLFDRRSEWLLTQAPLDRGSWPR